MLMRKTVNLLRTAVQIPDIRTLSEVQSHYRLTTKNNNPAVLATTRRVPKRLDELNNGGSLFWIIKNQIQARQDIIEIESVTDGDETYCRIYLEPEIMRVTPIKKRAIQGWRYLETSDTPKDLGPFNPSDDDLPSDVEVELRKLGVI